MRTFKTLAIAALLTAGAIAQASAASSFDSFDLGSVGASRQLKVEGSRVQNDAMNANASVIAPTRSTVNPAVHFERK